VGGGGGEPCFCHLPGVWEENKNLKKDKGITLNKVILKIFCR
jgi:hypothetical protein